MKANGASVSIIMSRPWRNFARRPYASPRLELIWLKPAAKSRSNEHRLLSAGYEAAQAPSMIVVHCGRIVFKMALLFGTRYMTPALLLLRQAGCNNANVWRPYISLSRAR